MDKYRMRRWINICEDLNAFHGTTDNVEEFDADFNDFTHFGSTPNQANNRLKHKAARNRKPDYEEGARVIPVTLKIDNPLRMVDIIFWTPGTIINKLRRNKNKELAAAANAIWQEEYSESRIHGDSRYRRQQVIDLLKSFGYDSIAYRNQYEGKGDSYIVFDTSQIVPRFRKLE